MYVQAVTVEPLAMNLIFNVQIHLTISRSRSLGQGQCQIKKHILRKVYLCMCVFR